jgi:hypothetical protein
VRKNHEVNRPLLHVRVHMRAVHICLGKSWCNGNASRCESRERMDGLHTYWSVEYKFYCLLCYLFRTALYGIIMGTFLLEELGPNGDLLARSTYTVYLGR